VSKCVYQKKKPGNVVELQYFEDVYRNFTIEAIGESDKKMENSRVGGFQ
jgi:hypothetical protein